MHIKNTDISDSENVDKDIELERLQMNMYILNQKQFLMEDKLQEIPILKKQIELYSNQKQSMKEEIILLIDEKSIEINKNHIL